VLVLVLVIVIEGDEQRKNEGDDATGVYGVCRRLRIINPRSSTAWEIVMPGHHIADSVVSSEFD
jgi:hypothetical protein